MNNNVLPYYYYCAVYDDGLLAGLVSWLLVRRGRKRDRQGSGYSDVRTIHVIGDCPPVTILQASMLFLFLNPCSLLTIIAFHVAVSRILVLHVSQGNVRLISSLGIIRCILAENDKVLLRESER